MIRDEIVRECAVCNRTLEITIYEDYTYDGGHYFGPLYPDNDKEYWECEECAEE